MGFELPKTSVPQRPLRAWSRRWSPGSSVRSRTSEEEGCLRQAKVSFSANFLSLSCPMVLYGNAEAAEDLGADGAQRLRRVILPLSKPGVIAGIAMVFVPSISTFYISQKLGNGKFYLIGDAIEGQYVANNLHFAAAIAFILMVVLLASMAVFQRLANRRSYGGA